MPLIETPHTRFSHTDLCPDRASDSFGAYRQYFISKNINFATMTRLELALNGLHTVYGPYDFHLFGHDSKQKLSPSTP